MMEVVVTIAAIRRAKLQSNRQHQQTNTQFFYRPDPYPAAQPCQSTEGIMERHQRSKYKFTMQ